MKVYVFDKDSTVADTWHRRHLIPENKKEGGAWIPYSAACGNDTPMWGTVALMRAVHANGDCVIILTGATDAAREETEAWFRKHDIPYDFMIMRAETADRHLRNPQFKIQRLREFQERFPDAEFVVMFDDHIPVKEAFEAEPDMPPVVVVNPCYPLPEGVSTGLVLQ